MSLYKILIVVCLLLSNFLYIGCSGESKSDDDVYISENYKIGFAMGTLNEERWMRDREIFVSKVNELGEKVDVQNANNSNKEQLLQVRNMIENGIEILVIVPQDVDKAKEIVELAKENNVKVICYDRIIRDSDVDVYISFDHVKVGEFLANDLVKAVPEGNYVIVNGAKTDYNSHFINEGYYKVLKPYINKKKINVIKEIWTENWRHEEAFKCIEELLDKNKKIDAVLASNDSLANGVIDALAEKGLAGTVKVVGQDADLAGCQRIVEGTQNLTVFKPIGMLAQSAAVSAVDMLKNNKININNSINNGFKEVPFYKINTIPVNNKNIYDVIIKEYSFHKIEEVYRNIPKENWPED